MWKFTEIADWWSSQQTESEEILDRWVENSNYSQATMITAASAKALMTFGAGFVDIMRLGDGVREGTLGGVGKDALRFVAIFPVGKAASLLKSAQGLKIAKVIADTGGPNCFWIASAKALAQIGHKFDGRLFASVKDLADTLGMNMAALARVPNLAEGIGFLRRIGVKAGAVVKVSSEQDIARLAPSDGSVVMIAVHFYKAGKVVAGHAFYAFRTITGQVRYMDRTVNTTGSPLYASLAEIAYVYRGVGDKMAPIEAAVLHNVFAKSVAHELPRLVMPVLGVVASEESSVPPSRPGAAAGVQPGS